MSDLDVLDVGNSNNSPAAVPNATACLVLGIISIATCWLYALPGLICGIIALVLHQKDKKIYFSNREKYEQSFKTSKAGFVCGIVGLSLSALMLIYLIIVFSFLASVAGAGGFSRF
ncbi:CCC motif membrane protein [Fluviicola sp.]|uniref:CCC motif membrane protein n=1 Tax=Fluviicola sp. TaxID=1917219 RepID=UPI0031DE8687